MVENVVEWRKHLLEKFQETVQISDRIGYGGSDRISELGKGILSVRNLTLEKSGKKEGHASNIGIGSDNGRGSERLKEEDRIRTNEG